MGHLFFQNGSSFPIHFLKYPATPPPTHPHPTRGCDTEPPFYVKRIFFHKIIKSYNLLIVNRQYLGVRRSPGPMSAYEVPHLTFLRAHIPNAAV